MSMGGGGSQPQPPSVQKSGQAEAQSYLAGQMFEAANAPTLGYENTTTNALLGPYNQALGSALTNRAAYSAASANQAIESQTNPRAYEAQQMALDQANKRVASLYGTSPGQYSYFDTSPFNLPDTSSLPSLDTVSAISREIGNTLTGVNIDNQGNVVSYSSPRMQGQTGGNFSLSQIPQSAPWARQYLSNVNTTG